MATALVLGGTGPTGPCIVEGLLKRGYRVTIMHSGQHEVEYSGPVEHIHGDVHFEETLGASIGDRTFDVVVAAYGRLKLSADFFVERTGRFISVGSSAMALYEQPRWGPSATLHFGQSDGPTVPDPERVRFFYLIYLAEQSVMEHHRAGHYVATHLRYPLIYGARQLATTDWCIVRRILDGRRQLIIADDGLKLQSRAHMENAAEAVLLAVDKPEVSGGKCYNVADERVLTLRQRIELIASALNHEFEFVSLPFELARPFHAFVFNGPKNWVLDISRTQAELGYRDVVPAEDAIPLAAQWLVEHQPERGGELEIQLQDTFDYAAEDAIIEAYRAAKNLVLGVPFSDYVPAHPYRHPKRPNEIWQPPQGRSSLRYR